MVFSILCLCVSMAALTGVCVVLNRRIRALRAVIRTLEQGLAQLTGPLALLRSDLDRLDKEIADSGFFELAELEAQAEKVWTEGVANLMSYTVPGKGALNDG